MNRRGSGAEDGHYHSPHAVTTGARVFKRPSRKERLQKTYAYARETYGDFTSTLVTISVGPATCKSDFLLFYTQL